jgi:DNA-binding SARP family transcriptional activator
MPTVAEYRILGRLDVRVGGEPIVIRSRRQRTLLAMLLLNANQFTPMDLLLSGLWGDDPPDTAVGQIQTLVWRSRRSLDAAITTEPGGYRLRVAPAELDAELFRRTAAEGAELAGAGRLAAADDRYTRALALWRGPVLADVPIADPRPAAAVAELAERRMAVEAAYVDVRLALGRHTELVPMLRRRIGDEPLREELRERLIIALHRCGRRAEALAAYREARSVLVAELGLEPGEGLRRAHARILAEGDDAGGGGDGGGGAGGGDNGDNGGAAAPPHPHQLPPDLADFVPRAEAADMVASLRRAGADVPVLVAVSGPAGSGKTVLAVHAAHRVRPHFPDGQLYVDLRGATGPRSPHDVLARFLRDLGVDPRAIPEADDERVALLHTRTAGRRLLFVLDDAAGEAQVRPMLPAEPGCAALVISRRRLTALGGAYRMDIGVFSPDEARDLMRRAAGARRMAAEPEAMDHVVRSCGYLPLAIRIAAARLAARPHWPVARLAEQLADVRTRLDVLSSGDLEVRASLALSERGLGDRERRLLRQLGALDAPDVAGWVVGPLLDAPVTATVDLIDRLVDVRLVDADGSGRYRLHDLVRAYARDQDGEAGAVRRAGGAWLDLAERAYLRLPGGFYRGTPGGFPRWTGWDLGDAERALADPVDWYEAERGAMVATVRQAAALGLDELSWELATTLARFFELREHLDDWRVTHDAALEACVRADNRRGQAYLRRSLGELNLDLDRLDDAHSHLAVALDLMRQCGDLLGEGLVQRAIGAAHRLARRTDDATAALTAALAIFTKVGDPVGRAQALHNLGIVHRQAGELARAEELYRHALAIFEEIDDPFGQAYVLNSLAVVVRGAGRTAEAERHLLGSIERCRQVGFRRGEIIAMGQLGELHLRAGAYDRASGPLRLAVAGSVEVGDRIAEAIGLRRLGELHRAMGNAAAARAVLRRCVALCGQCDLPDERVTALRYLAELETAAGPGVARPAAS